jgi:hypothetical protein
MNIYVKDIFELIFNFKIPLSFIIISVGIMMKLKNNLLKIIPVVISDIIFLYFTLFLYEYGFFGRIMPDGWIIASIIVNIIFFIYFLLKKQFKYLFLIIVPAVLLWLCENRFDRKILIYSRLQYSKKVLQNINTNDMADNDMIVFTLNENKLYIFYPFNKWEIEELTDIMDPLCVIIYDENDFLNEYINYDLIELNGKWNIEIESDILTIRVIKKLAKNWYYCIL